MQLNKMKKMKVAIIPLVTQNHFKYFGIQALTLKGK